MAIFALVRAEWSESRRLSRVQRLVAGVLSVVTFFLFNGLFQYLKLVGPFFFSWVFIPGTLFLLALFGGPIKSVVGASLGSTVGLIIANML